MYNWNDISPKQFGTLYSLFNSDILVLLLFHLMISSCYSCFKKASQLYSISYSSRHCYIIQLHNRCAFFYYYYLVVFNTVVVCCIVWYLLILHHDGSLDVDFYVQKWVSAVCSSMVSTMCGGTLSQV